jgi:hypothetical protein
MTAQATTAITAIQTLNIDLIQDGGAQMRVEMSEHTIADYAEELISGTVFPPVIVYYDGEVYWLADGFHRVEAARKIERETIEVEIREGSDRDAILHGIGANARHGLRRTQADKRHAVEALIRDPGWSKWSDRHIGKVANVDHKTVGKIRREVLGGEFPSDRTVLFKDRQGNDAEMRVKPVITTAKSTSLVQDLLKTISNDDLISECRRRGLHQEVM